MEQVRETTVQQEGGARVQKRGRKPLVIIGILLAVLAAAYLGLCIYATQSGSFWKGTYVLGQDVSGMTVDAGTQAVQAALPELEVTVYLYDDQAATESSRKELQPEAQIPLAELGAQVDVPGLVQSSYDRQGQTFLLAAGSVFLRHAMGQTSTAYGGTDYISLDDTAVQNTAEAVAQELSVEPRDTSYELQEDAVVFQMAEDGRQVRLTDLKESLESAKWMSTLQAEVPFTVLPAQTLTAQEIHDACAGEVKNATYDAETDSIVPEQAGAEFDVEAAQAAMDAAEPGETVTIPAQVELPAVTAEQLEALLFRDVLGECTTRVGGTSARKSNVKLSAAAINGYVMNTGDVFSYNGVVGKRTAARGYQAAPAYVQGQTVDEIGGGICQTSSTLYLACLRSNLEITERYAHRYIPSYIAAGMDATVSWGGPDYKFTNNTDYPIKIVTSYENNYLTVQILGTNLTGVTAKITNEYLSTTPYETIYEDDPTLAPGTEQVKTSPYTGYKYRTYRNLYDADGNLISSSYEATSDYKARNQVILRGPAVEEPDTPVVGPGDVPETTDPGTSGETSVPGTSGETTDPGTSGETTPETPSTGQTPSGSGGSSGESAGQTDPEGGTPPLVVDLPPAA